jgi:hypothetical protein
MSIQLPKGSKLLSSFLTGSHLYGTNTPDSDVDTRGIFLLPKDYIFGVLRNCFKVEDKITDTVYHEMKSFFKFAMKCNPNIIEYLFIPYKQMITSSPEWEMIVENRDLFLSNKAKNTFSGYAFAQMKRIKHHRAWLLHPPKKKPERKDFGLPSNDKALLTKSKIGAFNEIIATYLQQIGRYHVLKDQLFELNKTHNYKAIIKNTTNLNFDAIKEIVPFNDNIMMALEKEKAYGSALTQWQHYQDWLKHRNPFRAKLEAKFGYDTKHGLHLYRLVSECRELMTTGKITFPRPDKEHLLAIKDGIYTFEQLLEKFEKVNDELEEIQKNSILPDSPQATKIDQMCIEITKEHLGE